jgi:N-acetyldiaminopimelate deacetylase
MLDLIKIRHYLHRIPELGFQEFKTVQYIKSLLSQFPNLELHEFDFPAIVAEYKVNDNDYKLFRADMDALPILEKTGVDFASENIGKMHACGHDVHMTILIGLIEKVVFSQPEQNILFVFQPAEEGFGGAQRLLSTNFFDGYQIDSCYALHVNGALPVGTISSKAGVFFANTQELELTFQGISAHVAFPEKGKNALDAGMEFYQKIKIELQKKFIQKKRVICGLGKMEAGTVMNAVPDFCTFHGTIRAYTNADHQLLKELIREVAEDIAQKHKLDFELNWHAYYKEVYNNKDLYNKLKQVISETKFRIITSEQVFTGEDFGYFTARYPGLLFWLGANQGTAQDLHSDKFLPAEESIEVGVDILYKLI